MARKRFKDSVTCMILAEEGQKNCELSEEEWTQKITLGFCERRGETMISEDCRQCFTDPQNKSLRLACGNLRMNCVAAHIHGEPRYGCTKEKIEAFVRDAVLA